MPTKEWFSKNPKISAYISKELYQELEAWMAENRVKKMSQGLTRILESFLGVGQKELAVNQNFVTVEQFELLLKRIEALEDEKFGVVQSKPEVERRSEVAQSKPKVEQKSLDIEDPKKENSENVSNSSLEDDQWLTTKEAYSLNDKGMKLSAFSKLKAKDLKEKFNLEAEDYRKTIGGPPSKWIKKPLLDNSSHP